MPRKIKQAKKMKKILLFCLTGILTIVYANADNPQFSTGWTTTLKTALREEKFLVLKLPPKPNELNNDDPEEVLKALLTNEAKNPDTATNIWAYIPFENTPITLRNSTWQTLQVKIPETEEKFPESPLPKTLVAKLKSLCPQGEYASILSEELSFQMVENTPGPSIFQKEEIVETIKIQGPKNKNLVTIELLP